MPRVRSRTFASPVSEEAQCDKIITKLYFSTSIVRFARRGRETTGTQGVPDRLYLCFLRALWWECKASSDFLSEPQRLFLERILDMGGIAGCGDRTDLLRTVEGWGTLSKGEQDRLARRQIAYWSTRSVVERRALRGTP